jgi:hypothetical protein
MRVAFNISILMMLAMNGHPLFGGHACGHP